MTDINDQHSSAPVGAPLKSTRLVRLTRAETVEWSAVAGRGDLRRRLIERGAINTTRVVGFHGRTLGRIGDATAKDAPAFAQTVRTARRASSARVL
jgi:hypothetical protein